MLIYLSTLFLTLGAVPFFREKDYLKGLVFFLLGLPVSFYALKSLSTAGTAVILCTSLGIYLSYFDLKDKSLPGRLPAAAYFLSLFTALFLQVKTGNNLFYTFLMVVFSFVTIREISWLLLEKEGLGDADPSVAPLFFSFFPLPQVFLAVSFSAFSALIHYALLRQKNRGTPVPLIPHFLVGSSLTSLLILAGLLR